MTTILNFFIKAQLTSEKTWYESSVSVSVICFSSGGYGELWRSSTTSGNSEKYWSWQFLVHEQAAGWNTGRDTISISANLKLVSNFIEIYFFSGQLHLCSAWNSEQSESFRRASQQDRWYVDKLMLRETCFHKLTAGDPVLTGVCICVCCQRTFTIISRGMKWSTCSLLSDGWTIFWWGSCHSAALSVFGTPTR